MNKFRKSGLEFLVATDVAARGIDVDDIAGGVQLRPALRRRGLRASHRPHGPRRAAAGGRSRSCPGARCFRSATSSATPTRRIHRATRAHRRRSGGGARQCVPRQAARDAQERRIQAAGSAHRAFAGRGLQFHRHRVGAAASFAGRRKRARSPRPRGRRGSAGASRRPRRDPAREWTRRLAGQSEAGRDALNTRRRGAGTTEDPCIRPRRDDAGPMRSGRHATARNLPAGGSILLSRGSTESPRGRAVKAEPQPSQTTAPGGTAPGAASSPARRTGRGPAPETEPPDAGGADTPLRQYRRGDGRFGTRHRRHDSGGDGIAPQSRRRGGHPGAASVCRCGVRARQQHHLQAEPHPD